MKTELEVICALIKLLSQVNRHKQLGLLKIRNKKYIHYYFDIRNSKKSHSHSSQSTSLPDGRNISFVVY
ncbi:MAG: hypothetical protein F6K23_25080 [Okeania sp. SIO2C9]|uniref:hypothetical protein n=1 Tax=Okeania sp. SIO2C9 TaxID=2607791 RepID=UPI0013BFD47E|nr:hypothetical protein [Okeania sp. SIO2C9]NEQ76021.1 hypothetical protein [Okeania sp. SIO2C9]